MSEDQQLLQKLCNGDRDALRRIYEKYRDGLLTIAIHLLRDTSAAEDCLQDVFVALAGGAGRVRIRSSLKGYLAASIANRARDKLRRKSRQDVTLLAVPEPHGNCPEPFVHLAESEENKSLWNALAELPYEQREVITLHLHGRMTFKEIAAYCDVSINTVQSRYRYGIDKLRMILKGN